MRMQQKKKRPHAAAARGFRLQISLFQWPIFVRDPEKSPALEKTLAAIAFVGQDHKPVSVTATISNFVCEQESPLIDLVRHPDGMYGQLLRLANGTAFGMEHVLRLVFFRSLSYFRFRKVDHGQALSRMI